MFLIGCGKSTATLDALERSDSLMQKAQAKEREGDVNGAIQIYNEVLNRSPMTARAHLDLAILLHDYSKEKDYIGAIYHYRRYLELRPETEKKKMIESRIRMASQSFAATVFPHESRPANDMADLATESASLKTELNEMKSVIASNALVIEAQAKAISAYENLKQSRVEVEDKPVKVVEDRPGKVVAGNRSGNVAREIKMRTYRVKRGDTLSSIAMEMYGDTTKHEKIISANKALLRNPNKLEVGQILVIP